ncbi:hypothetical protein [Microvirga guangxiensis]|uniref:Uncharacterized protein n=1 Tax=Microvirga guangxiensis TaxID=549386 RepID=A0A1G5C033_9HYPH|nr:hypothetical protein [Microvirga guangxiensis]SCX95772.1 hypothetical protein SAMN02927923_00400 [Microvirga guangxiensis]
MQINWLLLTEGPGGLPIPTYGNYGGPNWTGGEFVGDDEPGDYTVPPEDSLDALFRRHDRAYDQPDTLLRAQADLQLIKGILRQSPDEVTGEGDLYAGGAALAMLYQIAVVNGRPELLATVDVQTIIESAIDRIEEGSISPEPQEVAALTEWLQQTAAVLTAQDDPILTLAAQRLLDLSSRLAGTDDPSIPITLTEDAFSFVFGEASVSPGDVIDGITDIWSSETLTEFAAAHHEALPEIREHLLDFLPKKLDFHADLGDFTL